MKVYFDIRIEDAGSEEWTVELIVELSNVLNVLYGKNNHFIIVDSKLS